MIGSITRYMPEIVATVESNEAGGLPKEIFPYLVVGAIVAAITYAGRRAVTAENPWRDYLNDPVPPQDSNSTPDIQDTPQDPRD